MKYFVISVSEDGDVSVTQHTKEELEREMNEHGWPDPEICRDDTGGDPQEWGEKRYLIIKGEIVKPRPIEVVKQVELP